MGFNTSERQVISLKQPTLKTNKINLQHQTAPAPSSLLLVSEDLLNMKTARIDFGLKCLSVSALPTSSCITGEF